MEDDLEPTSYQRAQWMFWECMRDYVRIKTTTQKRLTRDEMVGVGYAIEQLEHAHRNPPEKLPLRLLNALFMQDMPASTASWTAQAQAIVDKEGLSSLLARLPESEHEEVLADLERLRIRVAP
jgi:hypothetical protein